MSKSLLQAKALVETLLKNPSVRINNLSNTTEKIQKIIQDGRSNLHFISDFDRTMSRHWVRNKYTDALETNPATHGIPALYDKMTPEYKKESRRIYSTYYPIEIDQSLTHEQKTPYMIKWWNEAHEAILAQKLKREDLRHMAEQAQLELRPGVEAVLEKCRDTEVPFLVFSAGIGNIIEEILKEANLFYDNMHIVSNMMVFNEQEEIVAFKDPLIHVFNKSEFQLETSPYHKLIEERTNVILMGDSLGDLQMSQGVKHDLCLNIGFLNHDVSTLESAYVNAFDVVIEGDANMIPIIDLLNSIVE